MKVKISPAVLLALVLFQFGTTLVVNMGLQAGKDSWIGLLIGMVIGTMMYSLNVYLYTMFPDHLPTVYYRILLGKYLGDCWEYHTACFTCIQAPEIS